MDRALMDARKLQSEDGAYATIAQVLTELLGIHCNFCGGRGHRAAKCGTRKMLDRTFSNVGVRKQWGSMKGTVVNSAMRNSAAHDTLVKRSRLPEVPQNCVNNMGPGLSDTTSVSRK